MKRTISILIILLAVVSMASANGVWRGTSTDPNALLPWEDGSNWYDGVVAAESDGTVIIETQQAWIDPDVAGQYPAFAYLTTETTLGGMVVGMSADRPGKLHVGPTGVMTVTTPNCGMTWNSIDCYGTLINEGTINGQSNVAINRQGQGVVKLLGDSVFSIGGRAELIQYSGSLDMIMDNNALLTTSGDQLRNVSADCGNLSLNMYGNSALVTSSPNSYMYSWGDSSINDNASITLNSRCNGSGSYGGTLDINDSAVLNFAGTHGMLDSETININGGTLKVSNANIYGIRNAAAINVFAGALVCETAAAKDLQGNTINLSGTGIINGWSQITSGSLSMTGGKLGCSTGTNLGNINNNGGTISPNIDGIGGMNIGADLAQSSTASLEIDLDAGTVGSYDSVAVAGTAYLNGTLDLNVNYVPTDGDSFTVLTATAISGTFTNLDATSYVTSGGYPFWVAVGADSVIATYVADGNAAPAASAGPDVVIDDPNNLTATATLTGSYADDGRPVPPTYTYTWTQISGDPATIATPNALTTEVTVPGWGTYVFQLEVSDSLESGTDTVAVQSKEPPIIPVGPLVAHYTFDTDLADSSVNGFDLILDGASVGGAGNADAAVGGGSLYLGGGTGAVRDGQDLYCRDAVTVAFWTKKAGEPDAWSRYFTNGWPSFKLMRPDASRVKWQCDGTTTEALQYNNGVDNNGDTVVDPDIEDGDWHHVACVYDSSTELYQFYVDGENRSELSNSGTISAPETPGISIGGTWKGLLDDFRFYNVALNATEVDVLYQMGIATPCPMDLNGDGVMALDDITEIVLVIKDAPGYSVPAATAPAMDLNGDGSVALDDITEIVLVIKDAPGYSVACP